MNYSFNDERSELTKFCEGDSARAFDYFGAHFEQRGGEWGVMFRVWAPNAKSIAVTGDFNDLLLKTAPNRGAEFGGTGKTL